MSIRNIANVSLCLALLSVGNGVAAQNESRWHNVDINQQNSPCCFLCIRDP